MPEWFRGNVRLCCLAGCVCAWLGSLDSTLHKDRHVYFNFQSPDQWRLAAVHEATCLIILSVVLLLFIYNYSDWKVAASPDKSLIREVENQSRYHLAYLTSSDQSQPAKPTVHWPTIAQTMPNQPGIAILTNLSWVVFNVGLVQLTNLCLLQDSLSWFVYLAGLSQLTGVTSGPVWDLGKNCVCISQHS